MKSRTARALSAMFVFLIGIAMIGIADVPAQVIAPYGDLGASWCMITAPLFTPTPAYILALPPNGMIASEFRMTGLPADSYIAIATANPNASTSSGDPLGSGGSVSFAQCQVGPLPILLYSILLVNLSDAVGQRTLRVEQHTMPSIPTLSCPVITLCDEPVFTQVCAFGGEAYLNSFQNCELAVDQVTWGRVKALYGQ